MHHAPWPLQRAEADITTNTIAGPQGIAVAGAPALLHFSRHIDVIVWPSARGGVDHPYALPVCQLAPETATVLLHHISEDDATRHEYEHEHEHESEHEHEYEPESVSEFQQQHGNRRA